MFQNPVGKREFVWKIGDSREEVYNIETTVKLLKI